MIQKTDALVMRIWPHSNTSQIVSWLTPQQGRISTLNKGALRPKSPFLGQCDLFYRCELLYYTRSKTDLFIAKEVSMIAARPAFRSNWRAACLASYWNDLLQQTSVAMQSHRDLFTLANVVLDGLADGHRPLMTLLWGELQLLSALGLAPQLRQCALCHEHTEQTTLNQFTVDRGGLICRACAPTSGAAHFRIQPDVLAILRRLQVAHKSPRALSATITQLSALQSILGSFLEHHLDLAPTTRLVALNAMRHVPKR